VKYPFYSQFDISFLGPCNMVELFRDYGIIEDFPQRWSYHPGAVELEDGEDKWTYSPEQVTFTLELATEHQAGDEVEEEEENEAIIQNSSNIRIAWSDDLLFDNRGRNYVRRIFRRELRRLYRFQNVRFDFNRTESAVEEIPQEEWCSITNYYSSIVRALKIAISSLINDASEVVETVGPSSVAAGACGNKTSSNEGSCPADDIDWNTVHYDDLKDEEDHTNYIFPNCPTTQLVEFYEYQDLEVFQTNYQKLTFLSRGRDRDLCMNIENTLQICSNYRPHYHEFFVHFPARYMEKVERVIFIGGGDSMLLHEVLKYPELQKVVGLELDQQVTRKSFKYFQSQPHFDNDRVEWWYGDATKSLPLLPKEYWGSFDLVLVDLSETVMSMTVTGTLDIFSALSLLLKPEGIMVKNEPYIDQFSDFFDHTIQLFYGSPKICTQVLVMGSNKVDFLHSPVQNHPTVQTLLFENMQHPSDRYKLLHDYRKNNATQQGKCSEHTTNDQDYVMHGRKAGVLEVVDLDSVPVSQFDISRLESNIYKALRSEKLNPISTIRQDSSIQRGSDILVVLKEGFVVVRPWPEYNYIALDIQLWGAFSNLSSVRSKLVEAISGNDISLASSLPVSSYRIVTGGMFGSHTWETDKESIGIQMRQTRDCETPQPAMEEGESADASKVILTKVALEATFTSVTNLLPRNNLVVVVACGLDDDGSCLSIETLSKHPKVGRVIPVWACPDVVLAGIATAITTSENEPSDEDDVDVHSKMYECERSIVSQLNDIFGVEKDDDDEGSLLELDMFVLDPSVPYSMARIYSSVLGFFNNRDDWMAKEHVLLVPNPLIDLTDTDGATDDENLKDSSVGVIKELKDLNWRRNFLERYRKEYHRVPLFRAELMVRRRMDKVSSSSSPLTSSSSFESSIPWLDVGILSSSDRHFFYNLTILEASFQYELDIAIGRSNNSTRMLVSVERVTGGLHYYDTDNERDVTLDNRMYYPESYNKTSAIKQYQNQRPLARHSIFQYELLSSSSSSSSTRSSTATTEHNVTTTASTTTMPTWKQLEEILLLSMDAVRYTPSTIERYDNAGLIGDGAILAAAFTVASSTSSITLDDAISRHTHTHTHHHTHRHDNHNMVIMIWDGRIQVDVHLFSSSDMEGTIADQFATIFEQLSQLSLRLRDDQPRGYGRVVNFETDIVSQS
jgi:spermidine synthase/S-adenosylmethionine/arginine decarboxylase-like enzyme